MVRAHPTVPASSSLCLCDGYVTDGRGSCCRPCLLIPKPSPTIPRGEIAGAFHDYLQDIIGRRCVCAGAFNCDLAHGRPCLHARGGRGMPSRRLPALQLGDSGCRSDHRLHGAEEIPALTSLPEIFRTEPVCHGRHADEHQTNAQIQVEEDSQAGRHLSAGWVALRSATLCLRAHSVCSFGSQPVAEPVHPACESSSLHSLFARGTGVGDS